MHEGYDIDNVDEFFKKYGSYVLTIMKVLKIGFTVAGIAVPGLSHLGIVQGIESTAKTLDLASLNCRPLLDDASTSLRNQIKGDNKLVERTSRSGQMDFNNLKTPYGSDLRHLESFLRHHDPGRVLGNLNRMTTRDGDVRWVCNSHYRTEKSREAIQNFKAILKANKGTFSEPTGLVRVTIKSPVRAKEVYEAMVRTPGIRHLSIWLKWDLTQEDLQAFEAAATKAGIADIILEAEFFDKPGLLIHKNYKKCNPLVQLMCNGHIGRMNINSFDGFYQRVRKFPLMMKSRLQRLEIRSIFSPNDRTQRSALKLILKHSPHLSKLDIITTDSSGVFDFLKDQVPRYPNLGSISWESHGSFHVMILSHRKAMIGMRIPDLNDLSQDVRKLIHQGELVMLDIHEAIDESTWLQVADILRNNPRLALLNIRINSHLISTIATLVATVQKAQITEKDSSGGLDPLRVSIVWTDHDIYNSASVNITLNFPDDLATLICRL